MKKILSVFLITVFLLSLAGCKTQTQNNELNIDTKNADVSQNIENNKKTIQF